VHVCKRIDVLRGRVCERETACDDAWEGGGESVCALGCEGVY